MWLADIVWNEWSSTELVKCFGVTCLVLFLIERAAPKVAFILLRREYVRLIQIRASLKPLSNTAGTNCTFREFSKTVWLYAFKAVLYHALLK